MSAEILILHGPQMEVHQERERQDRRWGEQNHEPLYWLGIIGEEFGEVAKALIENHDDHYRNELIHLAACAIAAMESYDRNNR